MSKRGRKQFATSPMRSKVVRPNSKHPYGDEWPALATAIKKRDGYKCRAKDIGLPVCRAVYKPPFQHLLEAHHIIPYAQIRRHVPRLIISLCRDCHQKTHNRVWAEEITSRQKIAAAKFK